MIYEKRCGKNYLCINCGMNNVPTKVYIFSFCNVLSITPDTRRQIGIAVHAKKE